MGRMIRKQIYIGREQKDKLKQVAKESGVSEAEIVRGGIELKIMLGGQPSRDPRAWEEEQAFIQERGKLPALGGRRTWTREDAYRDRLPD